MKRKILMNFLLLLIFVLSISIQSCTSSKTVSKAALNQKTTNDSNLLIQVVTPVLENIEGTEQNWLGGQVQDKFKSNLQDYLGMRIVVDSKSEDAVKKLQREAESEAHNETMAIELGKISTAKFAFFSKIRKTNNGYVITVDYTDLTTGEQIASVTSKEYAVIEKLYGKNGAVDEITIALAAKLGINLDSKKKNSFENYVINEDVPSVSNSEIYVNGGTFFIGTKEYSVNDFIISKTEFADDAGFPIVNKSWLEVISYCNELSKQNKLECVYEISKNGKKVKADFSKTGYRLPKKEEWYWAATGAEKRNMIDSESDFDSSVWYIKNSDEKMHRIAQKKANSLGLYDMFGNIAEWCWDNSGENYHLVCGGFYGSSEKFVTPNNFISKHKQDSGENYIGFRLVRSCIRKSR